MQEPQQPQEPRNERSEFLAALRTGVLIGLGLLVVIVPVVRMHKNAQQQQQQQQAQVTPAPQPQQPPAPNANPAPSAPPVRLADFGNEQPSPDVRILANWVLTTGNARKHALVIVDKKDTRVYVFTPQGRLLQSAPALMGEAHGDGYSPGIGDKPLSAVKPWEKTTPAGRFVAEPGENDKGEDIVWFDYDLALAMHRVITTNPAEHRLERLATQVTDDNRISFGCINLPVTFYDNVLSPTVQKYGAIVYVLPEVKTLKEVFGAYDVQAAAQEASANPPAANGRVQKVAFR
jgi:hypothetical protein